MSKRYLPQRASNRRYPVVNKNNVRPTMTPNIFSSRRDYISKGLTGNRFQASQITRTATYRDANGNKVTLREDETIFSGPETLRGGMFVTPTKKITRK